MFLKGLISFLRLKAYRKNACPLVPSDVKSLLIAELTRLGDVISMMHVIPSLRAHFPHARVHVLVDERYASFLKAVLAGVEIHGVVRPESVRGFFEAVRLGRALSCDIACSMSPPKRNAAVVLASGARAIVGYLSYVDSLTPYLESTPVEAFGFNVPLADEYGYENIEERALKVIRALGGEVSPSDRQLTMHQAVYAANRSRLVEKNIIPLERYIVVHPFSGWRFRSWAIGNFVALVKHIISQCKIVVLFVCDRSDGAAMKDVERCFAGTTSVRFFASDDIVQTAVVMKDAALAVCNDSGPLHLAAALGTRVVGLFGPADPFLTAPRQVPGCFLYNRVECSPCNQRICIRPEEPCIDLLSPDEVFSSVIKQLSLQPVTQAVANG